MGADFNVLVVELPDLVAIQEVRAAEIAPGNGKSGGKAPPREFCGGEKVAIVTVVKSEQGTSGCRFTLPPGR